MPIEPTIAGRAEQPYVAIRAVVTMQTISEVADRLQEVFAWLGTRGLQPAGAPFFKYNVIDMAGQLEIEAGVPVATPVEGDDQIVAGVLPAGRYAGLTHVGHPDELTGRTKALLDWAATQDLQWDTSESPDGQYWNCRLEIYNTDPAAEPDMNKWQTELAIKLAD